MLLAVLCMIANRQKQGRIIAHQLKILPLPQLPTFPQHSLEVVRVMDGIRQQIAHLEQYDEFEWFAREYPRVYRYNVDHAQFRLAAIHAKYRKAHRYFVKRIDNVDDRCYEISYFDKETPEVYWDFDAFLNALSTSLDILARIVGTSYIEQTPPSFNKLCKKRHLSGCADLLRTAQSNWVSRMKDYRDCFVHYTSVDTLLSFNCRSYSNGFEVRCKLPSNPNEREILGFRFTRRIELLKYAIHVYRQFRSLDKQIAKQIKSDFEHGDYPKRNDNLFYLGTRNR